MKIKVFVYDESLEDDIEHEREISPCPFRHTEREEKSIVNYPQFRIFYQEHSDQYFIECFACGATSPLGEDEEDAVRRWNDRCKSEDQ